MKRHALAFVTVALAAVAATSSPAHAEDYSGFTQAPGRAYVKVEFTTFTSHDYFDLTGKLNDRGDDFTQRNLGIYAEYGIIRGLTVIAKVPVLRLNSYDTTNTALGIGDVQLTLKYGIELWGFHIAASATPELPLGNPDATVQRDDTGSNVGLPTGDGEFNLWANLGVSRSFSVPDASWLNGWVSAGAGYNVRTEFSDQIGIAGKVGAQLFDLALVELRARGQVVPSNDLDTASGFIYGEGTEYFSVGAALGVMIPATPLTATIEWEQAVAARKNLYAGPVFIVGLAVVAGG